MKNRPQPDEHGRRRVLYVILVALAVVVVGLASWKVIADNTKKPSGEVSNSTNALANNFVSSGTVYTTCLGKFHDTSLCRFSATESAQPLSKTAYKATMVTNQNGTGATLVYQQNGKGDTVITASSGGSATPGLNSVKYKGSFYIQDGNAWVKYPAKSMPALSTSPANSLSFMSSLVSKNLTKVYSEACGSLTCLKYQLMDSTTPNTTSYVWFDTRHYLLREWSSSDPSSGSIDMKISYQPVTISAPTPVEDFSAAQ